MGVFTKASDRGAMPIGVDIAPDMVRMLQFRRAVNGLELQAAGAAPLTVAGDDAAARQAAIVAAINTLRKQHRFLGRSAVTTLTPELVPARSVRLPQMPAAEVHQALQWEARDRLGFDTTDGQIAYFRAGEVRRGNEAKDEFLMFGAPALPLRERINTLRAAGLIPEGIDLQPSAILRTVERAAPLASEVTRAVLLLGVHQTQLMITQGQNFAFYKHLEASSAKLTQAVATKLGVDLEEAYTMRTRHLVMDEGAGDELQQAVIDAMRPMLEEMAREVERCLRYYTVTFRGGRPETLMMPGAAELPERARELIANTAGMGVEDIQTLRGIGQLTAATRPDRSWPWTLAAGLALYPLNEAQVAA
jgi:type IV pilus assembly protein PilM